MVTNVDKARRLRATVKRRFEATTELKQALRIIHGNRVRK
jgi:hypothetical protein